MSTHNIIDSFGSGIRAIRVDYAQVASQTQVLHSRIETETSRVENEYGFVRRKLDDRDGLSNAIIIDASEQNKKKAISVKRVFNTLTQFVSNASNKTENTEREIASRYIAAKE
jgi:hypothetical protein